MTSTNELKALKSENRKLKKAIRDLSAGVSLYLGDIDILMSGPKERGELGAAIAKLNNKLDMTNDQIRYFTLGVDHRKDDKRREYRRLVKKHRGEAASPTAPASVSIKKCGRHGCINPGVHQVYGSLNYYSCEDHLAEIEALVDSE